MKAGQSYAGHDCIREPSGILKRWGLKCGAETSWEGAEVLSGPEGSGHYPGNIYKATYPLRRRPESPSPTNSLAPHLHAPHTVARRPSPCGIRGLGRPSKGGRDQGDWREEAEKNIAAGKQKKSTCKGTIDPKSLALQCGQGPS